MTKLRCQRFTIVLSGLTSSEAGARLLGSGCVYCVGHRRARPGEADAQGLIMPVERELTCVPAPRFSPKESNGPDIALRTALQVGYKREMRSQITIAALGDSPSAAVS